jgi:nitrous oxidase accessory protein
LLCAPLAPEPGAGAGAPGQDIVVAPGTDIPTVARALAVARDGDRVVIRAGTYHEPELVVSRRLTLQGEGWPVLDGGGTHQVLTVRADSVVITGLVIRNVAPSTVEDRAGIKVDGVRGCRIEHNILHETFFGIYLARASGCTVRGNEVRGRAGTEALAGNAIHSWNSSDLVIEDNVLEGHRDGVYLEFTGNSTVRRNRSTRMLRYGLHFMFSNGNRYEENRFEANRAGVAVMYSSHVTIVRNRFARSWGASAFGLLLKDISDARLEENQFVENSTGLWAEGTSRVRVEGNEFLENGWAIRVMANASETEFLRNRFEGNSFDVATNSVNARSRFAGNYWDRYTGYDLDRDGYGDVPFAPVRLFALVVQQHEPALILQRSFFVSLLDLAERVAPVLTPRTMVDSTPLMRWRRP